MAQPGSQKYNTKTDFLDQENNPDYFNQVEIIEQLRAARNEKKRESGQNVEKNNDYASRESGRNDENEVGLSQEEKERRWAERMRGIGRLSQIGSTALSAAGYGQLGGALGDMGAVAGAAGSGKEGAPGGLRNVGSNLAGSQVSKIAQKKHGVSSGKSSAIGGAVAGALAGEGVKGIGQSALSWYVVDAMFIALLDPTLTLSTPALIYLNVHYIMSKRESKWFRPMFLWQKFTLLLADILFLFIILTILVILYFAYYLYTNPLEALKFGIGL